MQPKYDIDKIKFSVDERTYQRARDLYESGKVHNLNNDSALGYVATVYGTQDYRVLVSSKNFDVGNCNCYLGQNDTLCKHMIAVAIKALVDNSNHDINLDQNNTLVCSDILGELSEEQLKVTKQNCNYAIRKIKYYNGPSKTWFIYQNSLEEGCNRLRSIFSSLPVSPQTTKLIITLLIRVDKKLQTGVDDSNGTVGGFIQESVELLEEYARKDRRCIKEFHKLTLQGTCFDWEVPLVEIINKNPNRTRPN